MRSKWLLPVVAALVSGSALGEPAHYGFGRAPSPDEIAAFDIEVSPDGKGLPPGHGSVAEGAKIFATACASCHGEKGEVATLAGNALAGGIGTLASAKPVRTVGSYWPYATTLYDFIYRAMPFNAPQSLSADETYAVTAYVLFLNGIIGLEAELNAQNLAAVKMPNRDGFEAADWKAGMAVKQ